MQDSSLANRLELWGFEKGVMVFKDFSLGCGFEIPTIDVSCESDDSINTLKNRIRQFLNGLPSGLSIQFMQEITAGNDEIINAHGKFAKEDLTEFQKEIVEARLQKFLDLDNNGELPKQTLYVFIRKKFETMPVRSESVLKFWKKTDKNLKETHLKSEIQKFERVIENVTAQFSTLEIKAQRLSESETFRLLYSQWNPDRPVVESQITGDDIRDQVVLTDAVIGIDNFSLGSVYHKVISLKMLPENTFASMSQVLRALPFESRLFFSVEVLDHQKEISALQTQRRMAYAAAIGKKGVSDLESQAKLRDLEGILEEMIQGSEHVFKVALQIVLRSPDLDILDSQISDTLTQIREMNGAEGMVETVFAFDLFQTVALPQVKAKERTIKVNTNVVSDLLPLYGNWRGHEVPKVLLRTKEGGLLPFDPFAKQLGNSNMIVSGGSGAGKSYFANSLISQMMKEKPKVFILDIGASYKRTCENLDGQYIELGIKSDLSINPFEMSLEEKMDSERMDQKIKFLVTVVELMTKEPGKLALGRLERAELEKLIKVTLDEEASPRLSDLMGRLLVHGDVEIKRLGRILSLWCGDSPFGKFVDRPTTVRMDRDVVCFDLKNLDSHPDLQSICLFLITDLIWREIQKDRTLMKFTIFDECWRLLQDDSASLFIGDVFRTFRKYNASAIAISQTMDDFVKSKIAAAIMPNSSLKWILRQKGANQENLKTALALNPREMELISSLESKKGHFSEAFLMAEDKRQVVRVDSTPLEYWLFTSDPADISYMNELKKKNPSLTERDIIRIAAKERMHGASSSGEMVVV
jgi:conjugal transfer ATP-binding protein TraC